MALTKKQKLFIEEYLIDFNATQAAIWAGYSPDSARQSGSDNMNNPYIRAHRQNHGRAFPPHWFNADRILIELAKIALLNPANVINLDELWCEMTHCQRIGQR